jgi:hypothetical protein
VRIVNLQFNRIAFGGASSGLVKLSFEYENNFNIAPPDCPKFGGTVYDCIWLWQDNKLGSGLENTCLAEYEEAYLKTLPSGLYPEDFAKYGGPEPPSEKRYYRLAWKAKAPDIMKAGEACAYWVHPFLDRTLTFGELTVIAGWEYLPENPSDLWTKFQPGLSKWIETHKVWAASGAWKEQDFESVYCGDSRKWTASDAKGKEAKSFLFTELEPNNTGRNFPAEVNKREKIFYARLR